METLPEDWFSLRASYDAEAGQFQESGISSVICGPSDITQAHKPRADSSRSRSEIKIPFFL